jgi:hypothetical protein
MANSLERRLGRLEAATAGVGGGEFPPCPDCGWPDDGDDDTPYEIVWVGEDEDPASPESALCETCGERIPEIAFPGDLPPAAPAQPRE